MPLRLPPLRERTADVPDLVNHFLAAGAEDGLPQKTLTADAVELLVEHSWPGNVRELENVVRRLMVLYPAGRIDADLARQALAAGPEPASAQAIGGDIDQSILAWLRETFREAGDGLPQPGLHARVTERFERPLIEATLAATRGNQIKAAEVLGLNRNTLRKRIRDLGLEVVRTPRA